MLKLLIPVYPMLVEGFDEGQDSARGKADFRSWDSSQIAHSPEP
jgi:hypothetical protein